MTPIYLDNNATTLLDPEVAAAMDECQRAGLANPASPHFAGRRARRLLEDARDRIGQLLGARTGGMDADQVILTSGGTEANNLALRGLVGSNPTRVVISAIEHPSVMASADDLSRRGHVVSKWPVEPTGVVDLSQLPRLLSSDVRLVSVMLGNNETGVLQPVAEIAAAGRACGSFIHTDAVQAVAKIPVHFHHLGVDAMTVAAHKFHGPVGIGALIVRHGIPLQPLLFGGFQQAARRPGTESVALAVGMFRALEVWHRDAAERQKHLRMLRDQFEDELRIACPRIVIHGSTADRLPHTSHVAFPGLDRQAIVMALDLADVACSTGSACASGSSELSPVLLAMNIAPEFVMGSVRFSFSAVTTPVEITSAVSRIARVANGFWARCEDFDDSTAPREALSKPI